MIFCFLYNENLYGGDQTLRFSSQLRKKTLLSYTLVIVGDFQRVPTSHLMIMSSYGDCNLETSILWCAITKRKTFQIYIWNYIPLHDNWNIRACTFAYKETFYAYIILRSVQPRTARFGCYNTRKYMNSSMYMKIKQYLFRLTNQQLHWSCHIPLSSLYCSVDW